MRRWVSLVVVLLAALSAQAEEPLNLLFIGNSYTQGYMPDGDNATFANVPEAVARLAVAGGHPKPRVRQLTTGGQPLDFHRKIATTRPAESVDDAGDRPWTHLVLQELSTRPAEKTSQPGDVGRFRADVVALARMVRQNSPKATVVLYETWARKAGAWAYPGHYADPSAMQADLTKNYAQAAADLDRAIGPGVARIAPVGAAFGLTDFDAALYNPDGSHASTYGYRLAALVIYRTLYDETVSDLTYESVAPWIGLSAEQFARLQEIADHVRLPASPRPAH